MRKSIILLVILISLVAFLTMACTSEAPEEKKTGDKQELSTDTSAEEPETDASSETPVNLEGDSKATEDSMTTQEKAPETVATAESTVSTTEDGSLTSVTREDGTVVMVDAEGKVIEDTQADAESTPATTTTDQPSVGLSAGTAPAKDAEKEIKSRGDVSIRDKVAIIKTNFGDVYLFFFPDQAPNHVRNFIYLAEKDFFVNVPFHRIVKGFMAQAGIPRNDWTEDIPALKLETDKSLYARHRRGALSAARTGDPHSATSQFFLCFTEERTKSLDCDKARDGYGYTVYGQMFKGFETLEKLEGVKLAPNPQMGGQEISKPMQDVHIVDVVIEDAKPYEKEIASWKAENGL